MVIKGNKPLTIDASVIHIKEDKVTVIGTLLVK